MEISKMCAKNPSWSFFLVLKSYLLHINKNNKVVSKWYNVYTFINYNIRVHVDNYYMHTVQ